MTPADLARSAASDAAPPTGLAAPLASLWWDRKGDWARAHDTVAPHEASPEAAWVHAYLHRREGDLGNARYWYRRAGRPAASGPFEDEWDAIAGTLLAG